MHACGSCLRACFMRAALKQPSVVHGALTSVFALVCVSLIRTHPPRACRSATTASTSWPSSSSRRPPPPRPTTGSATTTRTCAIWAATSAPSGSGVLGRTGSRCCCSTRSRSCSRRPGRRAGSSRLRDLPAIHYMPSNAHTTHLRARPPAAPNSATHNTHLYLFGV